jgi:hypothetical protein
MQYVISVANYNVQLRRNTSFFSFNIFFGKSVRFTHTALRCVAKT